MVAAEGNLAYELAERLAAAREQAAENLEHLYEARTRLIETRQMTIQGRQRRAVLHDSAYARLEARLASLPLVEQAKGILMARLGCGPDEAFNVLRSASQHRNVKVRELAAEIVASAATGSGELPP